MAQVAIVTDSVSGIPIDYQERLDIHVLPNLLLWAGEEFRDGVDILPEQFYARMRTEDELPTTAAVPPFAFTTLFEKLVDDGQDVLGIFTGASFSAIYDNACLGRDGLGRGNITLIDSNTMSMIAGWAVIQAARAAKDGADLTTCEAVARSTLEQTGGFVLISTLNNLRKSGRITNAQLFVGSALKLKPILEVTDGEMKVLARIRTFRRAKQRLVETVEQYTQGKRVESIAVLHANAAEEAQALLNLVTDKFQPNETILTFLGPNIGTHAGPGALAIVYMTAES